MVIREQGDGGAIGKWRTFCGLVAFFGVVRKGALLTRFAAKQGLEGVEVRGGPMERTSALSSCRLLRGLRMLRVVDVTDVIWRMSHVACCCKGRSEENNNGMVAFRSI